MAWLVPMTTNPNMKVRSDESVAAAAALPVGTGAVRKMSEPEETNMKHPVCSSLFNAVELHERWKQLLLQQHLPLYAEQTKRGRGGPDHSGLFTQRRSKHSVATVTQHVHVNQASATGGCEKAETSFYSVSPGIFSNHKDIMQQRGSTAPEFWEHYKKASA